MGRTTTVYLSEEMEKQLLELAEENEKAGAVIMRIVREKLNKEANKENSEWKDLQRLVFVTKSLIKGYKKRKEAESIMS